MAVLNEVPFPGGSRGIITAVVTGAATLQAKSAADTWVAVPDGAVTDTVFSFRAPAGSIFRFTGMTGTVALFS